MQKERGWTEEQLRDAVRSSTSFGEVSRALGMANRSSGYIARCIAEAGLDTSHFTRGSHVPLISDERLRELVPVCSSVDEVLELAGVEARSSNANRVRNRIGLIGLDTSHFVRKHSKSRKRPRKWTDEQLRAAVASSISMAQVIRALGLVPLGGNYEHVQRWITELGINTSHLMGKGWNKGGKFRPFHSPIESVLVAGRLTSSHHLKNRLFRLGLKEQKCECCGWCERSTDGRIPLELDHVNGDKTDNRLENLRILCPNCHSLQPTHRGRNKKTFRAKS